MIIFLSHEGTKTQRLFCLVFLHVFVTLWFYTKINILLRHALTLAVNYKFHLHGLYCYTAD
jgi:hypothetical protein